MKAQDYLEKYGEWVWQEWQQGEIKNDGAFAKLYIDLMSEIKDIANQRNVKTDKALLSIIDEQNKKWNALRKLFIKRYGKSPFNEDAFRKVCYKDLSLKQ